MGEEPRYQLNVSQKLGGASNGRHIVLSSDAASHRIFHPVDFEHLSIRLNTAVLPACSARMIHIISFSLLHPKFKSMPREPTRQDKKHATDRPGKSFKALKKGYGYNKNNK